MKTAPVPPIDADKFSAEIRAVAAGIKALRKGPFNEKTLLLLIAEHARIRSADGSIPRGTTGRVSVRQVKAVLDACANLDKSALR